MKFLKILFIFLCFLALVGLSDIIYLYRNEPSKTGKIFLYLALRESQERNVDKTLNNLNTAAYFHLIQNKKIYRPIFIETKVENNLTKINAKTRKELFDYLVKVLPVAFSKNSSLQLAFIYYNLGLIVYKNNFHQEAASLFLTAINLETEAGHLHLELANLYFNDGEIKKGNEVLNRCLQFKSPKRQCQEYINTRVRLNSFEQVGIFKNIFN